VIVLAVDDKKRGVDVAGRLGQVGGDLIGQDTLCGEHHAIFEILGLFRLAGFEFGELGA